MMTTGKQLVDQVINVWEAPKSGEDEDEEVSYAGETEREVKRKRRGIKAVLSNDGKQGETCIRKDAKDDQSGHGGLENVTMKTEIMKHGKAGEEKKNGDME